MRIIFFFIFRHWPRPSKLIWKLSVRVALKTNCKMESQNALPISPMLESDFGCSQVLKKKIPHLFPHFAKGFKKKKKDCGERGERSKCKKKNERV